LSLTGFPTNVDLVPTIEADVAIALSITKTIFKVLTPAAESDVATPLTLFTVAILVPVDESDTAAALSVVKPIFTSLVPVAEIDMAVALLVLLGQPDEPEFGAVLVGRLVKRYSEGRLVVKHSVGELVSAGRTRASF
jgi:hypothetical protein